MSLEEEKQRYLAFGKRNTAYRPVAHMLPPFSHWSICTVISWVCLPQSANMHVFRRAYKFFRRLDRTTSTRIGWSANLPLPCMKWPDWPEVMYRSSIAFIWQRSMPSSQTAVLCHKALLSCSNSHRCTTCTVVVLEPQEDVFDASFRT